MDFDEWYKALSPTLQQYVKTFAFNPTERNVRDHSIRSSNENYS
jgi:hypothetical protein